MRIRVTNRDGRVGPVDCESGELLMRVLANRDLVEATCGGECSCATCHVYVDERALAQLPTQSAFELDLLAGLMNTRPSSRLSCQITLDAALDGIGVEIAKPG